jgi:hypothetical protein
MKTFTDYLWFESEARVAEAKREMSGEARIAFRTSFRTSPPLPALHY